MSTPINALPITSPASAGVVTSDKEYRPETQPERDRREMLKELDDCHALSIRLEKKITGLRQRFINS